MPRLDDFERRGHAVGIWRQAGAIQAMVIWAGIAGALLGWIASDYDGASFFLGGLFGLIAGWQLAKSIRAKIATVTAELREELLLSLRASAPPSASEPAAQSSAQAVTAIIAPQPGIAPERARRDQPEPDFAPQQPGWLTEQAARLFAVARSWLFGGNTIVRIGLIVLFFGLSFLASYAAAAGLFPIELRLALVGAFGIALLLFGFRSRAARPGFALALQGGGVAVIYLTIFAATRFYDLLPLMAAFVVMAMVCVLACALALLQRSQALAVTAFAGGFAVPLLVGGDSENALGLFGYVTLLNLAVLAISRAQPWRVLNLVGFVATFGIAALWGATSYTPSQFMLAQIMLIVSVMIYVAIAILYTRASPGRLGNAVDTSLLFGPALAGFGLQIGLVGDREYGSAFAALGFAALYLGAAAWSSRRRRAELRLLDDALLAIGIGFVTVAIPLALGARWTSAAWALEGAAAVWVGVRQARWMPRLFGLALLCVASLLQLAALGDVIAPWPFVTPAFAGGMMVAIGWLLTAWLARALVEVGEGRLAQTYTAVEARLSPPAFIVGFFFWCAAWAAEAARLRPPTEAGLPPTPVFAADTQILLAMLAALVSAAGFQWLARRRDWTVATWPARVSIAALTSGFLLALARGSHVLFVPAVAIWCVAIAAHGWMLRQNDEAIDGEAAVLLTRAGHAGGVWLAVALLADMLWLGIERAELWDTAWSEVTLLIGAVLVLAAIIVWVGPALRGGARRWPLDRHAHDYAWLGAAPVALLVYGGTFLVALFSSADTAPLPLLPLLNPVDLSVLLALVTLLLWRRALLAVEHPPGDGTPLASSWAIASYAALAFAAVNGAWLRAAHHVTDVPWTAHALFVSATVQAGLAILWTLLALALMVVGHRRGRRRLWLVGAALLGVTVAKLLLVDLNTTGGGARIVAFIAVGVLMLAVGYLAPLPPKREEAAA